MNLTGMFIIFGWPEKTKHLGEMVPAVCPHCQNEAWIDLIKVRQWFTLFFLPVIPLGRPKYYAMCSVCQWSVEIDKETEIGDCLSIRDVTEEYANAEISHTEYQFRVNQFFSESTVIEQSTVVGDLPLSDKRPQQNQLKRQSNVSDDNMTGFECPNCSNITDASNVHCPQCGTELRKNTI